jgi:hypothetical protein
MRPLVSS